MFGKTIDYHILKPLTHQGNIATEKELDARAEAFKPSIADASAQFKHTLKYFPTLQVDASLSYLDVGCGAGLLANGLCLAGARDVTGVDLMPRNIVRAETLAKQIPAEMSRPIFIRADIHSWFEERKWDVVFAIGVMEHVRSPDLFLQRLCKLLKPGGLAFLSFEPFHSPAGDHMQDFFRVRVPWRGILFSEHAIMRLRRECYRPTDHAVKFEEIAAGLNMMRFSEYENYIKKAKLDVVQHWLNPDFTAARRSSISRSMLNKFATSHFWKDYFVYEAYSVLRYSG